MSLLADAGPWQLVCASCGSHSITRRARGDHRPVASTRDSFYCEGCEQHHDEVYDKKAGELVGASPRDTGGGAVESAPGSDDKVYRDELDHPVPDETGGGA